MRGENSGAVCSSLAVEGGRVHNCRRNVLLKAEVKLLASACCFGTTLE